MKYTPEILGIDDLIEFDDLANHEYIKKFKELHLSTTNNNVSYTPAKKSFKIVIIIWQKYQIDNEKQSYINVSNEVI